MGAKEKITDIQANLLDWEWLQQLPAELEGFKLQPSQGITGQVLNLATYVSESTHTSLELIYTDETFDYIAVKNIGLHNFRDERYIFRDKEKFAAALSQNKQSGRSALAELLHSISREVRHPLNWEYSKLGTDKWDYFQQLPQKIGSYELFIKPDNPVDYITGSVIFLDYCDFEHGNQLYFVYNTFRNEIFAGEKKNFKPQTTSLFTVPVEDGRGRRLKRNGKVLKADKEEVPVEELLPWETEKMEEHLCAELQELAK